jgi:hypothetical protein
MTPDLDTMRWRKSSHSSGQGGACVELAFAPGAIRDSKNPVGPVLRVAELTAFLSTIKHGRFDLETC